MTCCPISSLQKIKIEKGYRQNDLSTIKILFFSVKIRFRAFELKSPGCEKTIQKQFSENAVKVMFWIQSLKLIKKDI